MLASAFITKSCCARRTGAHTHTHTHTHAHAHAHTHTHTHTHTHSLCKGFDPDLVTPESNQPRSRTTLSGQQLWSAHHLPVSFKVTLTGSKMLKGPYPTTRCECDQPFHPDVWWLDKPTSWYSTLGRLVDWSTRLIIIHLGGHSPLVMPLEGSAVTILKRLVIANHTHTWW